VPLLRHYVIISPMNALVEQLAKNNQDLKVAEIEGVLYLVKKENTNIKMILGVYILQK